MLDLERAPGALSAELQALLAGAPPPPARDGADPAGSYVRGLLALAQDEPHRAEEDLRSAALRDHARAQLWLARTLAAAGDPPPADADPAAHRAHAAHRARRAHLPAPAEARIWLQLAAAAGEPEAMTALADDLAAGAGGPADPALADRWRAAAVRAGQAGAASPATTLGPGGWVSRLVHRAVDLPAGAPAWSEADPRHAGARVLAAAPPGRPAPVEAAIAAARLATELPEVLASLRGWPASRARREARRYREAAGRAALAAAEAPLARFRQAAEASGTPGALDTFLAAIADLAAEGRPMGAFAWAWCLHEPPLAARAAQAGIAGPDAAEALRAAADGGEVAAIALAARLAPDAPAAARGFEAAGARLLDEPGTIGDFPAILTTS